MSHDRCVMIWHWCYVPWLHFKVFTAFHIAAGNFSLSCNFNEWSAEATASCLATRKLLPSCQNDCLKGWGGASEQTREGEPRCFKTEDGFIVRFTKKMCIVFSVYTIYNLLTSQVERSFLILWRNHKKKLQYFVLFVREILKGHFVLLKKKWENCEF